MRFRRDVRRRAAADAPWLPPTLGDPTTFAYRAAEFLVLPPTRLLVRTVEVGPASSRLPEGGFVACPNHTAYADPFVVATFLRLADRPPFFLAKSSLFGLPVLGRWLTACGQIPVHRGTSRAVEAYRAALEAVRRGACCVVYPESTVTSDPDGWPMAAKTGAARIALETGAPLVPIGLWGAQDILGPRHLPRPRRTTVRVAVGEPVDIDDLRGRPVTGDVLAAATERLGRAMVAQVELVRGETAPPGRWDPAVGRRVEHDIRPKGGHR